MASITCRNGETFPATHRHASVAEVRQCQGAVSSWQQTPQRVAVTTDMESGPIGEQDPARQGLAKKYAGTPGAHIMTRRDESLRQEAQGNGEWLKSDPKNVYLNPKGVPAQLAAFDGSKLAGAERVTKELGEFTGYKRPNVTRVAPELEAKVPDGRYAIERDGVVKFYRVRKVTKGQWAGRTFVDIQAGDDEFPVRFAGERAKILAAIGADVKAAAIRYGMELGKCSQCGRTLTNPESIAAGIGPICLNKIN